MAAPSERRLPPFEDSYALQVARHYLPSDESTL